MAKKATKRELLIKTRAGIRNLLLKRANRKSYLRPDAYKPGDTKSEE